MRRTVLLAIALVVALCCLGGVATAGVIGFVGALPSGHGSYRGCPASLGYSSAPGFHDALTVGFESGPTMNAYVVAHENGTLAGATRRLVAHGLAGEGTVIPLRGDPHGLHTYAIDAYVDSDPNWHYDARDAACGLNSTVTVLLPTWAGLANATARVTPATPNASSTRRYAADVTRNVTVRSVALGGDAPAVAHPANVTVGVVSADGSVTNATAVTTRATPRLVVGRFAHPVRVGPGARVVVTDRGPNPVHATDARATLVANPHGRAYAANASVTIPARPAARAPSVSFDGSSFPSGEVRVQGRFPGGTAGFVVVTENGSVVGHTAAFGANLTDYRGVPVAVSVSNGTHRLGVTVYRDADGNGRLDAGDRPYRVAGAAVGENATVRVGAGE